MGYPAKVSALVRVLIQHRMTNRPQQQMLSGSSLQGRQAHLCRTFEMFHQSRGLSQSIGHAQEEDGICADHFQVRMHVQESLGEDSLPALISSRAIILL